MATVIVSKNTTFLNNANIRLQGLSGTNWLSFLDAVGRVEGNNTYNINNGQGYYGIYQHGQEQLNYMNFFNSFGAMLNVTSFSSFQSNPIAQEIAALMEFAGVPSAVAGTSFTSKYNATLRAMSDYDSSSKSSAMFSALMGKTFTIKWEGTDVEQTFTIDKSSISGAAHLIGQGSLAKALQDVYKSAYNEEGNLQTNTIVLNPNNIAYADGSNISFATYMSLFDGYNINTLTNAMGSQFDSLLSDLLDYRKDKITEYIGKNSSEIAMDYSSKYDVYIKTIVSTFSPEIKDDVSKFQRIIIASGVSKSATAQNDLIIGLRDSDDQLIGGEGSDTIYGGKGDDVLMGNDGYGTSDTEADYLSGGDDFDTYIAGKDDTINDSDGKGLINFNGIDLTGVKTKVKDSDSVYEDKEGFIYEEKDGKLIITKDSESITVENWSEVVKTTDKTKEALGIKLSEGGDVEVSTESNSALECLEEMPIPVKLDRVVEQGEEIVVQIGYYTNILQYIPVGNPYWIPVSRHYDSYSGTWSTSGGYMYQPSKTIVIGQRFHSYGEVTFSEGEQEKDFIYRWNDNAIKQPNRTYPMTPKLDETNSTYGDSIKVTIDQSGTGTIIDDDPATRIDPVILDTNKDGFISTTPLANSTTYFDITSDGLRERVGWVSGEDALLVYDKNENGRIDGIDEMFGNLTQSGFDELKQLIDSNYDNKIDRKDILFNRLQLWHDYDQDGVVDEGELKSLKEEGITSIDLNSVQTNINTNGNVITEASHYATSNGEKELIADVHLEYDARDTIIRKKIIYQNVA